MSLKTQEIWEMGIIKKETNGILELKSIITEMENIVQGLKIRYKMAEESLN